MSKARELADLGNAYSDGALSSRNMVVNGSMIVAQRSSSVAGVTETDGYKTVDRFQFWTYSGGTYTLSQDSAAPSGFAYSHKVLNTATTSTVAGTGVSFRQRIEAQNLQQLAYNTADAKDVTLSFWVKSTATGTWAVRIYNPDSGRMVTKTYAVSSANTWEKKQITFAGDTSGIINNDSGYGFEIAWWLAAGTDFTSGSATGDWETYSSTKEADGQTAQLNTGGDWAITGVQLEIGDTSTPFEHRSFSDQLQACQRYYKRFETTGSEYQAFSAGVQYGNTIYLGTMNYHPEMRATPSFSTNRLNSNDFVIVGGGSTYSISSVTITGNGQSTRLNCASSGMTLGDGAYLQLKSTGGYVDFDAEL